MHLALLYKLDTQYHKDVKKAELDRRERRITENEYERHIEQLKSAYQKRTNEILYKYNNPK